MNRGKYLRTALLVLCVAGAAAAHAQQRIYLIGYLNLPSQSQNQYIFDAFRAGLSELGYVEGKNIIIDARYADNIPERLPELAADLVRQRPDVIVTGSTPVVLAAKMATTTIPIVMGTVHNPVGEGIISSLARPGGNITGMSVQFEDTLLKQFDLIRTVAPKATRIAVMQQTAEPTHNQYVKNLREIAAPAQIQILPVSIHAASEFDGAFAKIRKNRVGALIVLPSPVFNSHAKVIAGQAAANRIPAIYPFRSYAEAGGLMSLGIDLGESFRRAAAYVDRILRGAQPADLPVQQPTKIDLVVNLKTAEALGIKIPQSILIRADRIIQ